VDFVNATAAKYLEGLIFQGAEIHEVEYQEDPGMPAYLGGDEPEFNERIDLDFRASQRLGEDAPLKVVVKNGHCYFYHTDVRGAKWTYDIRLAQQLSLHEAERMVREIGGNATIKPAPPAQQF
jgi:hypothetical protein